VTTISPVQTSLHRPRRFYLSVASKFSLSQMAALAWMIFSIWLSLPWVHQLSLVISRILHLNHVITWGLNPLLGEPLASFLSYGAAIFIIAAIAYIPGYLNAFLVVSLLLDRQPAHKTLDPVDPVTILLACHNEEGGIGNTIQKIAAQDYSGSIEVIVIDNASIDRTAEAARVAGERSGVPVRVLHEPVPGKNHALNRALPHVKTQLVITLDADTLLHKSAVRYIVARLLSAPDDVCAVAGAVLVRNSRDNLLTRMQEWDYFLGIASVKRLQGLYQGTLVAQGAFSLYKLDALKAVGGWPDAIGEDIVLTWGFLERGWRVYFEPLAVAFTDVPVTVRHFVCQRSRWARGMIEGLKAVKPWEHPRIFQQFLTGYNLMMPYLDTVYTVCWLPGLILAFFGIYWIVGPLTLFVLPITLLTNFLLYRYQKHVFEALGLRIRRNRFGFLAYVLGYQMMMAPTSVWGYIQEVFHLRRVWK
jgi:biofilm PGA synthesis N-glycosyltransferase PgaC